MVLIQLDSAVLNLYFTNTEKCKWLQRIKHFRVSTTATLWIKTAFEPHEFSLKHEQWWIMYVSEAFTHNCSRIRTAASRFNWREVSIGFSPLKFVILMEAPCSTNTAMAPVEFIIAAWWTGVLLRTSRLFTSAPFCRSNRMTSVLLNHAAFMSAVWLSPPMWSTETPASRHSLTLLMSPSKPAAA